MLCSSRTVLSLFADLPVQGKQQHCMLFFPSLIRQESISCLWKIRLNTKWPELIRFRLIPRWVLHLPPDYGHFYVKILILFLLEKFEIKRQQTWHCKQL